MCIIERFNIDEVTSFLFDRICSEIFIFIKTIDLLKLNILYGTAATATRGHSPSILLNLKPEKAGWK
jgi:hypothetical protein